MCVCVWGGVVGGHWGGGRGGLGRLFQLGSLYRPSLCLPPLPQNTHDRPQLTCRAGRSLSVNIFFFLGVAATAALPAGPPPTCETSWRLKPPAVPAVLAG